VEVEENRLSGTALTLCILNDSCCGCPSLTANRFNSAQNTAVVGSSAAAASSLIFENWKRFLPEHAQGLPH